MSDLALTTSNVSIGSNDTITITNSLVVPIQESSTAEVGYTKNEYSIVGDALYASVSADDAPQWLLSIIDSVLAVNLANGLADLTEARTSILAALSEIDVAKNQYAELINIDVTIDGIIASRLATLNATVAANRADVVNLEITKVTAAEALVIAADRVTAEINGGAIRGELNRVDTSVATVAGSLAATTLVLEAAYENNATSISTLENTVSANDTGAQARFAYNSALTLNGVTYNSGFGLATSLNDAAIPVGSSEFWIKADSFRIKDTLGNDYLYWNEVTGTLEITGDIVGSTIVGSNFYTAFTGKRIELETNGEQSFYDTADNLIMTVGLVEGLSDFTYLDLIGSPVVPEVRQGISVRRGVAEFGVFSRGSNVGVVGSLTIYPTDPIIPPGVGFGRGGVIGSVAGSYGSISQRLYGVSGLVNMSAARKTYNDNTFVAVRGEVYGTAGSYSGNTAVGGYFRADYLTDTGYTYTYGVLGAGLTYDFYAAGSGANYGPFTGTHDGLVPENTEYVIGDIVCDDEHITSKNVSNTLFSLKLSSTISTPAIGVAMSSKSDMVPAAISNLDSDGVETGTLPKGYKTIQFNAVGEGQLNVCGEGGGINNGDLIVTSSMPGKGMRQLLPDGTPDNIVRNYTVAKARGNHTFSSTTEIKMIPCIYLCG